MRSAVVLPQPDGPDEDEELAVRDVERELVDGVEAVVVDLLDAVERNFCHYGSLQMWNAGPSAGSTPSRASSPYSGLELGEGDTDRLVRRARREAEKTLAARSRAGTRSRRRTTCA